MYSIGKRSKSKEKTAYRIVVYRMLKRDIMSKNRSYLLLYSRLGTTIYCENPVLIEELFLARVRASKMSGSRTEIGTEESEQFSSESRERHLSTNTRELYSMHYCNFSMIQSSLGFTF